MPCPLRTCPTRRYANGPDPLRRNGCSLANRGLDMDTRPDTPLWGDRSRRMERKDFTNFCQIFRPACKRQEGPSEEP
jgi:hypothetical protein